ncbi:MAG: tetratricopeptide repeat protein [Ignavibacteriae bacterium]|nr:tetratricopeptide repeat protein [Ignavibacteriota bacterium]
MKKKAPLWFYLVAIIIPILLIVFLEISLNLINYGKNLEQWVEITEDKLILNPDIGARYFSNIKNYPHSNHDSFNKQKSINTFRVFVFGGSSTAGFPYQPNGSFSRYLRDRLILVNPSKNIEVINLGITASNTNTIVDLLPGVIEQKPDLVIIYSGHNEYYGALGVGSTESVGNSKFIIDAYLYLNNFRITQLLKNLINGTIELFVPKKIKSEGTTLMARMASEKAIKLNSDIYKKGVEQFRNNIDEILLKLAEAKVPTIIGTLASNILDQKPFVDLNENSDKSALEIYQLGLNKLKLGNYKIADSLLFLAKDLDGLRFRAPSDFNKVILELSKKHKCFKVDFSKQLSKLSPNGIIGNNIMIDHLHPTLEGHFIMGRLLYENIIENKLLLVENKNLPNNQQDSIVKVNFANSDLDSIASNFRIINLFNDWPFVEKKDPTIFDKLNIETHIDSLALKIVKNNLNWEIAHQKAYQYYLSANKIDKFIKEMNVLISQFPYKLTYYNFAAQELIHQKKYNNALTFLLKRFAINPDDFSIKWLGNIYLSQGKSLEAINFLEKSAQLNQNDPQVLYNLCIAYAKTNQIEKAFKTITACIDLKSDYPNAKLLREQLLTQIKSRPKKSASKNNL